MNGDTVTFCPDSYDEEKEKPGHIEDVNCAYEVGEPCPICGEPLEERKRSRRHFEDPR